MSIRMVRPACLLATILVGSVVSLPAHGRAAPYCDPRVDSGCYARWCAAMGGEVYNDARGYGCDTAGGARGGGASFGDQVWMGVAEGLVGSFMQGLLAGIEQHQRVEAERLRQLDIERRAFIQQYEEQERLRRRNEEERRQEFRAIKERLLRQMGTDPPGRAATPDLRVDEAQGTLGARELRPRDLRGPEPGPLAPRAIRTPPPALSAWERASCGAVLMRLAETAARTRNLTEAAYLSEQAAGVLTGQTGVPDVECPRGAAPAVPGILGRPTRESAAMSEAQRKHALVSSKLFARTTQLMADRRIAAEAVERAEEALADAGRQRDQAEGRVTILKAAGPSELRDRAPERALADALEALRDAQELEAERARLLAAQRAALADIEARLEHDREAAETLAQKPVSVDDLLRDMDVPVRREGSGG